MLLDPALPSHYQAMRQVHAKLSDWSPSIFVGHNSISFDENLLR
jgi:exodeoxyribonuclease-1